MLFVGRQVSDHVGGGNHLGISADFKTVFDRVFPALPLSRHGAFTKCIRDIQAARTQAQTLIQTLCAAADDDDLFALERFYTVIEFVFRHGTAMTELQARFAPRNRIKVIFSFTHTITSAIHYY